MKTKNNWLYLDGRVIPATDRRAGRLSPGCFLGRGVFESMRAVSGRIFLLERHLQRLTAGAKTLGVKVDPTRAEIGKILRELIALNHSRDSRVRLMAWTVQREAHFCAAVLPYQRYQKRCYRQGFRAWIFPRVMRKRQFPPHVKSLDYRFFLEAYREARRRGWDEALLQDQAGHLVEGSRSNYFVVERGVIKTPPLTSGCLKGVTRQWVREWARDQGLPWRNAPLTLKSLLGAREAFLTNSLGGIMPLVAVNGQMVRDGKPGPLTRRLLRDYDRAIRKECEFPANR